MSFATTPLVAFVGLSRNLATKPPLLSTSFLTAVPFSRFQSLRDVDKQERVMTKMMATESSQHDHTATTTNHEIQLQKQSLRKHVRGKLKLLSQQEIKTSSDLVWKKLIELPIYQTATSVGIFLSMPKGEINTQEFIRQCVLDGKTIYVPQVGKDFEQAHMELLKIPDDQYTNDTKEGNATNSNELLFYETWPKNKWNIPEPPPTMSTYFARPGDIDLLVVPGLAFDLHGNRLGQGKGYYDRFINRMMNSEATTANPETNAQEVKQLQLIAVCLDEQLIKDSVIPVQETDVPMHMILSPSNKVVIKNTNTAEE